MPIVAAESGNAVVQALTSAFTTVASDMTSAVTSVLPIALGIVGTVMVVIFGVKIFKRITGKA